MSEDQYQQTGKKIPLKMDELMNFVVQKLEQFDYVVKGIGSVPDFNPYEDPIIYTTQEGKTVQVPKEIQRQAVINWNNRVQDNQEDPNNLDFGIPGYDNKMPTQSDVEQSTPKQTKMQSRDRARTVYKNVPYDSDEFPRMGKHPPTIDKQGREVVVVYKNSYTYVYLLIAAVVIAAYYLHKKGRLQIR